MKLITISRLVHRGVENIAMRFEPDTAFTKTLRGAVPMKWSRQNACWYCVMSQSNLDAIRKCTKRNDVKLSGDIISDKISPSQSSNDFGAATGNILRVAPGITPPLNGAVMCEANAAEMRELIKMLALKSYSALTIRTYKNEVAQFFKILENTPAARLTTKRLGDYFQYCFEKLRPYNTIRNATCKLMALIIILPANSIVNC